MFKHSPSISKWGRSEFQRNRPSYRGAPFSPLFHVNLHATRTGLCQSCCFRAVCYLETLLWCLKILTLRTMATYGDTMAPLQLDSHRLPSWSFTCQWLVWSIIWKLGIMIYLYHYLWLSINNNDHSSNSFTGEADLLKFQADWALASHRLWLLRSHGQSRGPCESKWRSLSFFHGSTTNRWVVYLCVFISWRILLKMENPMKMDGFKMDNFC